MAGTGVSTPPPDSPSPEVDVDPVDASLAKADFPIFANRTDPPLVFLDSAASSQKPSAVLAAMDHYYEHNHANVHRAAYDLAEDATNALEGARRSVAGFVGAPAAAFR